MGELLPSVLVASGDEDPPATIAMGVASLDHDPETLAEALAFVDGFDYARDDNITDESSSNSDHVARELVETHKRRRSDVKAADLYEKAKSKRKNAVYSARLRGKKKDEMQTLKEQVEQLQMQLDRLKSTLILPSPVLSDSVGKPPRCVINVGKLQNRPEFLVEGGNSTSLS
ncbi:hypothetical protein PInf_029372 [Phytophthora infestans]|nr:hypothetical protein PInf_029372 [Phytophthora infestans]